MNSKATVVDKQVKRALERESGLMRGMKGRHIFMISLGGVIGTGLFMSSGYTLAQAGPGGAVLAYLLGGFNMYMVMLCLGELAVTIPVAGSFLTYAREFIHPSAGFCVGWLYWLSGVVTLAADFVVSGILLSSLFPSTSVLFWVVFWLVVLMALNCLSVNIFGEAEFWFCSIKVIAIICLLIVGGGVMLGLIGPDPHPIGFSRYFNNGGLFPNGISPIFATMIVVAFAFNGTEIIGITAGESDSPEKSIPKAVNNTAYRTLICYVATIAVIAAIIPWQQAGVSESIFAEVFRYAGIPYAHTIMTLVVVTSALSSGNSWLYCASRSLWSLARDGAAPASLGKLSKNKVPLNAMIFTVICSAVALLTEKMAPETLYIIFVSVAGLAGTFSWMAICLGQYNFRKRIIAAGKLDTLKYKTPFYPLVPFLGFTISFLVMVGTWFDPATRIGLIAFLPFLGGLLVCYYIFVYKKHKKDDEELLNS